MIRPKLYIDMDGTTAEWRTASSFEELLEEGYFANLRPYQNVVDAIKLIIKERPDIRVCILTAYLTESRYARKEKRDWLTRYLPEIKESDRYYTFCDVSKVMVASKGTNVLRPTDFLLDDYSKNLHEWAAAGGTGIKLRNGINGNNGTWKGHSVSRTLSAEEIAAYIIAIISKTGDDFSWEELKLQLFLAGHDAQEDFLGYQFSPNEDKATVENRLDEAYMQMPEAELGKYFFEYGIYQNEEMAELPDCNALS